MKNKLHNIKIKNRGKVRAYETEAAFKLYRAKLRDLIRIQKDDHYFERFKRCNGDLKNVGKF